MRKKKTYPPKPGGVRGVDGDKERHAPDDNNQCFISPKYPGKPCAAYLGNDIPEMRLWTHGLASAVIDKCQHVISKAHRIRSRQSNSLIRLGLKLLRQAPYAVWKTDKDGGFAIMPHSHAAHVQRQILQSSDYREVNPHEASWEQVQPGLNGVVKHITKVDNRVTKSELTASVFPGSNYISTLTCTVKTHKAQGAITCRAIHSTQHFRFSAVAKWVRAVLKEGMAPYRHIIHDTAQLIDRIKGLKVPDDTFFLKGDVRDFYMTGDVDEIAEAAMHFTPPPLRAAMKHAVQFLVSTQYIRIKGQPNIWQTRFGSGMGLMHSGELADATLLYREPKSFQWHEQYGVWLYLRYKDDILIFITRLSGTNIPLYWRRFLGNALPFRVQHDSINNMSFIMLDLHFPWQQMACLPTT